jgi:urease accessory protein UreF
VYDVLHLQLSLLLQVQKLAEELQRKEMKWGPSLAKLQEQVKLLERENQQLHEDNHKLKLKTVSSKVCRHSTTTNKFDCIALSYYLNKTENHSSPYPRALY